MFVLYHKKNSIHTNGDFSQPSTRQGISNGTSSFRCRGLISLITLMEIVSTYSDDAVAANR